jgi:predicted enzyme related to lactoylglutathione lyase
MFSHLSFASLPVTDLDRALAFWRDVMGLTVVTDASSHGMRWVELEVPGARTRLHLDPVAALPETERPVLPLITPNLATTVETLRGRSAMIVAEPKTAEWDPGTTYATIRDSEGNLILIASRRHGE